MKLGNAIYGQSGERSQLKRVLSFQRSLHIAANRQSFCVILYLCVLALPFFAFRISSLNAKRFFFRIELHVRCSKIIHVFC